jgi:hemerythrin-like domain-containing protein
LADMVDDHVRYEEKILFPHLQRRLSREQFEIIGRQIQEENRSCPKDLFEDQFLEQ